MFPGDVLSTEQIREQRKQIEADLAECLEETGSEFELEDIKQLIDNEEEQDDFNHLLAMFDMGQGLGELETVVELITDAWNFFPHKSLGGLSPAEIVLREKQRR